MPRWPLVVAVMMLALGLARGGGAFVAAQGSPTPPAGEFVVSEERSSVRVHVDKAGAFSFAGHRHEISAPVRGSIVAAPENLAASSVELHFAASGFRVRAEGEPEGDAPKVQEVMLGPRVLDAARFGEVVFRSRAVSGRDAGGGRYELQVDGELTLHGVTQKIALPVSVVVLGDTLRATARATIRHEPFGLTPVTAGGGTVRVKDEIAIDFEIVAAPRR